MQYTPEFLKKYLGENYEEGVEYLIETHKGATVRALDPSWKLVGSVPDGAPGESGTMVVFKKVAIETPEIPSTPELKPVPAPEPKPGLLTRLKGHR